MTNLPQNLDETDYGRDLRAKYEAALDPQLASLGAKVGPNTRRMLCSEGRNLDITLGSGGLWTAGLSEYENGSLDVLMIPQYGKTLQEALDVLEVNLTAKYFTEYR